ncbi:glucosaminidase domain-containing protein [Staphylococcus auricularis]|mgnify:CR=1 FL=1|uniref:glucosaminidase domain-containing protein n=1 Tax=Staphylococcus auricularis TaxID=29379 RepID=UPI00242A9977|nr:glucosaminidase domain-containing protein [Staphylococcus auricularis]
MKNPRLLLNVLSTTLLLSTFTTATTIATTDQSKVNQTDPPNNDAESTNAQKQQEEKMESKPESAQAKPTSEVTDKNNVPISDANSKSAKQETPSTEKLKKPDSKTSASTSNVEPHKPSSTQKQVDPPKQADHAKKQPQVETAPKTTKEKLQTQKTDKVKPHSSNEQNKKIMAKETKDDSVKTHTSTKQESKKKEASDKPQKGAEKSARVESITDTNISHTEAAPNEPFVIVDSKDTRQFIKSIAKKAHCIGQKQNLYASVLIAQAVLESGSGQSQLAQQPNYNLFGIKGDYKGKSVQFKTLEVDKDQRTYKTNATFRKYPNYKASLLDYAQLLKHGIDGDALFYQSTWKNKKRSYRDAIHYLAGTYASDPNYAQKLNALIEHYDLTRFDNKKRPNLDAFISETSAPSYHYFVPFKEIATDDTYPYGQCTWYVYQRMTQFNKSIGAHWGNAHEWNNQAQAQNYRILSSPEPHTIAVFEADQLGAHPQYGHVAFVEKVHKDGAITISESNVKGLGKISHRKLTAKDAGKLKYIEGKAVTQS